MKTKTEQTTKEIKGFTNYTISKDGLIFSNIRNKYLSIFITDKGYPAVNLISDEGKRIRKKMHRLIYENFIGKLIDGLVVDHKNHNTLDYSIGNLQQISSRTNLGKDKWRNKNKSSKYLNVTWNKNLNKWRAYGFFNKKRIHLGYYINEEDAFNATIKF